MRTQLTVSAAALLLVAALTGCDRTTGGTVAMTTEAGPPLTSRTTPSKAPSATRPRTPPNTGGGPAVPAPANATTMTCSQYAGLNDATKQAVVEAILDSGGNPLGPEGAGVAKPLADVMCQFLPTSTVSQVLLGGGR